MTTILAKMQFDANTVAGNACDVEKMVDKKVIGSLEKYSEKTKQSTEYTNNIGMEKNILKVVDYFNSY
jgi:hypothetical protein